MPIQKKIHGVMSIKRRQNAIIQVSVDGVTVEGVHDIRAAVFHHFSSHFKAIGIYRLSVENLHFRKLSGVQAGNLTKPFSLEELKQAALDCDSYKSPSVTPRFPNLKFS
jgi:hypothetical protein